LLYTEEGTYTVTLSVDGGACGSDEITYVDFITTNPEDDCILTLPPDGETSTEQHPIHTSINDKDFCP